MNEVITEQPSPAAPAKPRRKQKRVVRRKPAAAAAHVDPQPPMSTEHAGMTQRECPLECSAARCVVSWKPYCAHPRKGGLQGGDLMDPAAVDRLQRAKKALAYASVDRQRD